MKFARRAEGIKSGRMIFKKAREDARTRHHVYVTAALMEYYCSKVILPAPFGTRELWEGVHLTEANELFLNYYYFFFLMFAG